MHQRVNQRNLYSSQYMPGFRAGWWWS